MSTKEQIEKLLQERYLIIDGAMGTQIQGIDLDASVWLDEHGRSQEGCNELLNVTASREIGQIHEAYLKAGAQLIKTNTFGAMDWVLDEYDMAHRSYELAKAGAQIVSRLCKNYPNSFTLGSMGPGTKLPSLGHIDYEAMYQGYKECARGLIDGGVDIFLLETCQDPLQIKAALHACDDISSELGCKIPIMVSVTMELSGSMLIGTDAQTIATILEPFDLLSLGFNCGTGPKEVMTHLEQLSETIALPLSVHANAGLPHNEGGCSVYKMDPATFARESVEFCRCDGLAFLGGCCGTTPEHIAKLAKMLEGKRPKPPTASIEPRIASLFNSVELKVVPAPLLVGERSNATGSKAFRELILAEDYEGTLSVAQEQVRSGAHCLDLNVEFAGRDGAKDMREVAALYNQKIPLPIMVDATNVATMESALRRIGGRAIINSANLEDGQEKFDAVCKLAKRYGAALVCLVIDEKGMAKDTKRKLEVAKRMYERATSLHGLRGSDLIFDMLTFTVGSGDEEYRDAAIQTIEAIRAFAQSYSDAGLTLGLSNISFGLSKEARIYLNSVFLHHCIEAGMSSVIINVKHIIPLAKMSQEEIALCEELLFDPNDQSLFKFIDYFSSKEGSEAPQEEKGQMPPKEEIIYWLKEGQKDRLIDLCLKHKEGLGADAIVNEVLIEGMKEIGELFGSGQMQLPFVLQSAESMKAAVDALNPYLSKKETQSATTLAIGTVKGDVHDVGKNLVDIILSNNGFKVYNLGIKCEFERYVEMIEKQEVDAIGMSGLLVKSTSVMLENLKRLQERGIKIPVLLGGAALTRAFVDEYCRKAYEGPLFYCRDAFDGVVAMSRIEAFKLGKSQTLDTKLKADGVATKEPKQKPKEYKEIAFEDVVMPEPAAIPSPPFWGKVALGKEDIDLEQLFEWVNKKSVIKLHWGFKRQGMPKEQYEAMLESKVYPEYERIKRLILDEGLLDPKIIYGYYRVKSDNQKLLLFDENEQPLGHFSFPRQQRAPHRCISDYFSANEFDTLAITCVSAGAQFSKYESKLMEQGLYSEYNYIHGMGVELAEALAEMTHKKIRMELGILREDEKASLGDVRMSRYCGARYSFGYPACPDMAQSRLIFDLLEPEKHGITLNENFMMTPEQTTTALVVHHPKAIYYAI